MANSLIPHNSYSLNEQGVDEREGPNTDVESSETSGVSQKPKGQKPFEASLALLASIIGGGIVGVPFSMEHTGIPLGLILLIVFGFCAYYASVLYFETKLLSPHRINSLYEMSFVVLGKSSIYLVASIIFL